MLLSADTDFGELLARSNAAGPSVILLRRQGGRRAREIAALILANLVAIVNDLNAGALVVIDNDRESSPLGGHLPHDVRPRASSWNEVGGPGVGRV